MAPSPSSGLVADVRDAGIGPLVVGAALERHGRLDVLVNNVGHFVHPGRAFVDTTEDEWHDLFAMNLQHVLRMTHAALPPMIEQGDGGSIINLTTVEAFRGIPHHPVYAAYKAAVTQFGKSLALDVGRHGIRVNDIAPDVTRSLQLPYERWLTDGGRGPHPDLGAARPAGRAEDAGRRGGVPGLGPVALRHRHHHPLRRRHLRGRRLVPQRPATAAAGPTAPATPEPAPTAPAIANWPRRSVDPGAADRYRFGSASLAGRARSG